MTLQEASIAWEKRQAGIRARRHAAESQARWAKWGASNGVATGAAAKAGREEPGPEPRGSKADTASAAARAARRSAVITNASLSMQLIQCCISIVQLLIQLTPLLHSQFA